MGRLACRTSRGDLCISLVSSVGSFVSFMDMTTGFLEASSAAPQLLVKFCGFHSLLLQSKFPGHPSWLPGALLVMAFWWVLCGSFLVASGKANWCSNWLLNRFKSDPNMQLTFLNEGWIPTQGGASLLHFQVYSFLGYLSSALELPLFSLISCKRLIIPYSKTSLFKLLCGFRHMYAQLIRK